MRAIREPSLERRILSLSGTVQGVGFRPFVFGLAARFGLTGSVRNGSAGVTIDVEGPVEALDDFTDALHDAPPLARVEGVRTQRATPRGSVGFAIAASDEGSQAVAVSPDVATCADCLRELLDPRDRRYRYPFIACASCGPRLTIVLATPFDRDRTTMRGFAMCEACLVEYEDPHDRRFHAQTVACSDCGPRLRAADASGRVQACRDEVAWAAGALAAGGIVAVKGLGGYHLACDARQHEAVARLRARKDRDEKPFAIMVRDLEGADTLAALDDDARALLSSPARPIVLVPKRAGGGLADAVAPGSARIGLMLPYTPLHHLLLAATGRPLVMTSANRADEPLAYRDDDAFVRLAGIADGFLLHDRPIVTRCDDSVVRAGSRAAPAALVRRSRGYAPLPVALPSALSVPTLAVGGDLKGAFALGLASRVFVSHHVGDLAEYEAYRAFVDAVGHYEKLFGVRPRRIACDLHPGYASAGYARERAASMGLELAPIQHHHAHMAGAMAENGLERAIVFCFDGAGYGLDGATWGGEVLVGSAAAPRRAAHLAYVAMPGGDRAAREPWRMAVAHTLGDVEGLSFCREVGVTQRELVRRLSAQLRPRTSSVGRLFDAAAAIVGACHRATFEAQAAMCLEAMAESCSEAPVYAFALEGRDPCTFDARPVVLAMVRDVRSGVPGAAVARGFHLALAALIAEVAAGLRAESEDVVLTGGVFLNAFLVSEAAARLEERGLRVHVQRELPPGDGGLGFGQLAACAARDAGV